ncbi:hypothetical protein JD292_02785 [Leucobacter sp. CSA2]|uniref:Bacteriocin biosynthesis cyclodehydratase domain-containing protein n=1 Tax=Leucobacter edaphi TaxID=2796472 RepID=A0A934UVW3_9MICO|nr:hypothetical protein [Leucobacter edaphi]MBK0421009.1 hypothetical protein [Leucobacter edaphi]
MTTHFIRLDPALPICWEDLDTLRIGFDRAVARVRAPGPAAHRLVTALRTGVSAAQLDRTLETAGPEEAALRGLLAALGPALAPIRSREHCATEASPPLDVGFAQGRRSAPALREALSLIERISLRGSPDNTSSGPPGLVIQVERYAEPADRAHRWLMAGIPHLLVRFSDREVSVGPLIGAAGRPCHQCLCLHRVEAEPALPVLAAQLIGSRPASESGRISRIVAVLAEAAIELWLAGDPSVHRTIRVLPVAGDRPEGPPREETAAPHPECGCGATPGGPGPADGPAATDGLPRLVPTR